MRILEFRTEVEEKEKEILSKMEINKIKECATDLIFINQILDVTIKYFSKDEGLENISIDELLNNFHKQDLEFFNIFDEDVIVDFLSNMLLIDSENILSGGYE